MLTGWVHERAEATAGGHKHQRTGRPAPQGLKAAIGRRSVGVQSSRVVARGGVAVERSWSRGGGSIVVRPVQEVHSGYPSRPPAVFGVHVTEGGMKRRRETRWGESLQFCEGWADPGSERWSARLPEQHHSTTALISNMI